MATLDEHPTVIRFREKVKKDVKPRPSGNIDVSWLRKLCFDTGADDVGFVEVDRPELASQRHDILKFYPNAKTLISIVCRMNREPIRSTARSVANLEFHHTTDRVDEIAHRIVAELQECGIDAINPSAGFPMEMERFPGGKIWLVSHKPVAVAAGLGHMGIHRNVIHPQFGNFIILGTVLMNAEVIEYGHPLDYNPCLECKLCVAACPVGAIGSDGAFNFSACSTHNYREFLGGFTDWVEDVADSNDAQAYRRKMNDSESASVWQSLSFGANYKAAYCMAVCPAGEDVISPFLGNRAGFVRDVVRPLQEKEETIHVIAGSDAEEHVTKRFPSKRTKKVHNGLNRVRSIQAFLNGLPLVFQRNKSEGLDAVYHFSFTGKESVEATVTIRNKTLLVRSGHSGTPDIHVTADTTTWLGFVARERNILTALLTRRIRIKGSPKLLFAFGKCFPS